MKYLSELSNAKLVLWCYFTWYLVVLFYYFDGNPEIWITSLGIGMIVGFALYLSASSSGKGNQRLDFWQTFRCFFTPFCVSSFASLVKGRGFVLIFPRHSNELLACAGSCFTFTAIVLLLRWFRSKSQNLS